MLTVNIHDAKTRLSELIARAVAGEPFIIAKAGKPMVKVEVLEPADKPKPSIIGCLKGQITIPDEGLPEALEPEEQEELERLWYDGPIFPTDGPAGKRRERPVSILMSCSGRYRARRSSLGKRRA